MRVFCSQCGHEVADGDRFCSSCGAPVERPVEDQNSTTAAIELGALDPQHDPEELPELSPGTGMLVVVRGPNAGSRFLLDRPTTTVGRHPDSDIFLDDVTVSRRHADLLAGGDTIVCKDLGSLNGTYVNGERVDERQLTTGDEVQVGRFKLLFVGADGGAAS
ncbi:FHA domain-containing protein [Nitriliruptoraceae bacterium ZYF776]|nr:FHA domain-containing protein [Profundirhabdus halotolerans]